MQVPIVLFDHLTALHADATFEEVAAPDIVFVPGGYGQTAHMDGRYVTAAGVAVGIDLAPTLAEQVGGAPLAQLIQLGIEYDPQPPHDAGSPATAPAMVRAAVEARRELILRGPAAAAAGAGAR